MARLGYSARTRAATYGLVQITDILREVLDVGVGQRGGDAGHVARVVGPPPRLEVGQLLLDVLRPLAGDARNLVLPDKAAEMAHRTEDRVGSLPAGLDFGGIHLEFDRGLLLRGEELAQQRHVLGRELFRHRRHLLVTAASLLEILELDVDVTPALSGEDRVFADGRIA